MIRLLKEAALILALAGLWAARGYFTGAALETIGFDAYRRNSSSPNRIK